MTAKPAGGSTERDEGLLHDARNLIGALGLYCDLLSMPGVLQPQHRHYAEDVRLLSTRSAALIERLMEGLLPGEVAGEGMRREYGRRTDDAGPQLPAPKRLRTEDAEPVALRGVVERCSGLLTQVAGGRPIDISFGEAAALPVRVEEEKVERILVNLIRNSAAALDRCGSPGGEKSPGLRIELGCLVNRVEDPKPWPFRRVRMVVEDAGCGMEHDELERLLSDGRAPSRGHHGIGFRVVRDLVAGSGGDLRIMSWPGEGTRVQIEWPVAAESSGKRNGTGDESFAGREFEPEPTSLRAPGRMQRVEVRDSRPAPRFDPEPLAGGQFRPREDSDAGRGRAFSC